MRILTLNQHSFAMHCRMLEARVLSDGYEPDLIVGIARGGAIVAEQMFADVPHVTIHVNDYDSDQDRTRIKDTKRHVPRILENAMLVAQSLLFTFRNHGLYHVDVPEGLDAYQRILVVDDAVNSGSTLASVIMALGDRCRAAAITITSVRTPILVPHYHIYNHTIIRFPWEV